MQWTKKKSGQLHEIRSEDKLSKRYYLGHSLEKRFNNVQLTVYSVVDDSVFAEALRLTAEEVSHAAQLENTCVCDNVSLLILHTYIIHLQICVPVTRITEQTRWEKCEAAPSFKRQMAFSLSPRDVPDELKAFAEKSSLYCAPRAFWQEGQSRRRKYWSQATLWLFQAKISKRCFGTRLGILPTQGGDITVMLLKTNSEWKNIL